MPNATQDCPVPPSPHWPILYPYYPQPCNVLSLKPFLGCSGATLNIRRRSSQPFAKHKRTDVQTDRHSSLYLYCCMFSQFYVACLALNVLLPLLLLLTLLFATGHICNSLQRSQSTDRHSRRAERNPPGARGGCSLHCYQGRSVLCTDS